MSAVVLSFLAATLFEQFRSARIDRQVSDIVENAMPSIHALSLARSGLRQEMVLLDQVMRHRPADLTIVEQQAFADQQERITAFQSYLSYPYFASESAQAEAVSAQAAPFDSAVHDLFQALAAGSRSKVDAAFDKAQKLGSLLDEGIRRLVEFNASQGQRLALRISQIRTQSLTLVIILDLVALLLSVGAALLSVRILRNSTKSLEDRATELEQFSGRVAHDLKGPLSGILLATALGERLGSVEKQRDAFTQVRRLSARMNHIIDGLLDFARSGARPSEAASTELGKAIDDTLAALREEAARAGAALQAEAFERPIWVHCDQGSLASVLGNLTRNAIKFIGEGSHPDHRITLRVKRQLERIRVEVEDNGPGIETDKLDSIFAAYFRASQTQPGLGLGLATVKRIVEGYGGSVGVTSRVNEGSLFWFELPAMTQNRGVSGLRAVAQP